MLYTFFPHDAMPWRGVRLSVRHVRVFCRNEKTYLQNFFTIGSHTILVFHTICNCKISTGTP